MGDITLGNSKAYGKFHGRHHSRKFQRTSLVSFVCAQLLCALLALLLTRAFACTGTSSCSGRLLQNGERGDHPPHRAPPASAARREHRLSCQVEPFAASYASAATTATIATATIATGRIGRTCDSITRRGEGMGSLHDAPQWQRFRQGSISGDAGGPSAQDAIPAVEHCTDPARW